MAFVAIPNMMLPYDQYMMLGTSSHNLNATTDRYACQFVAPKSGNIDIVGVRTGAVTTSQSLDVGIYTIDNTTGFPTTTQVGGTGTIATPAANTVYRVTLASVAAVTVDTIYAIVVKFTSTAGDLNILSGSSGFNAFPCIVTDTTGTWAKQSHRPIHFIHYDTPEYVHIFGIEWFETAPTATYNSGTAGTDEYAVRFRLPFPATLRGWWGFIWANAGADFEVTLYDGNASTPGILHGPATLDGDWFRNTLTLSTGNFSSTYDLAKDTTYRLGFRPKTANNVVIQRLTYDTSASNDVLDALPHGKEWYESVRVDQGAFTDNTANRVYGGIIISRLDDGVSAGGGGLITHPGMVGGMRG